MENYCLTRNTKFLREITDPILIKFIVRAVGYTLETYPDYNNKYNMMALEIIDIIYKPVFSSMNCNYKGLSWVGNSCYMDSVLFALFSTATNFVYNNVLNTRLKRENGPRFCCSETNRNVPIEMASEIDLEVRKAVQGQLRDIYTSITGGSNTETCTQLRRVLRRCPNVENYHDTRIKDAGEFLTYILEMFPTNVARRKYITYVTNDIISENPTDMLESSSYVDDRSSIINMVDSHELQKLDSGVHDIRQFVDNILDSGALTEENKFYSDNLGRYFSRRISYSLLISTPYLIFRFQRLGIDLRSGRKIFIGKKILPSQILTIKGESVSQMKFLFLSSIVVYENLHYTVYFRCGNLWYYYDDISEEANHTRLVGDYNKMLRSRPSPVTNGTLYFYT